MRILLTLPHNEFYKRDMPDLGLGYLAACLKKDGHEVHLFLRVQGRSYEKRFLDLVRQGKFDIFGIKVFPPSIIEAKRTVELIRSVNGNGTVILGGPQVSGDPQGIFNLIPKIDYAFHGEAEIGLVEFVKTLESNSISDDALSRIPNLVWRKDCKAVVNQRREVDDLDSLPFPAWELMRPAEFPSNPANSCSRKWPIAPVIISRGCSSKCTFCTCGFMSGYKIRSRSAKNFIEEIKVLIKDYHIKEFQFFDSNCAHPSVPLKELCKLLISEKIKIIWSAPGGIRIDCINKELAILMKKSGCYQVCVGIESGSPRILKQIRKGITLDIVQKNIKLLRDVGMEVLGLFMIGFPGETLSEIKQTISFARKLPITSASFAIFCPLPGTEAYREIFKNQNVSIEILKSFDFVNYKNNLSEVPCDRLRKIQKSAYLRFYLRPHIMIYFLKNLDNISKVLFLINRVSLILIK